MATPAGTEHRRALAVTDAARALGVSERTVWRLIAAGDLKAARIGRRRVVPITSIDELLETQTAAS